MFATCHRILHICARRPPPHRSNHSTSADRIRYESQGNIAIISLCHPAARNAIDLRLADELRRAVRRFEADASVAVGVLHGVGGTFCAGTDLKSFDATSDQRLGLLAEGGHFAKPMVAGIGGFCVGSGLELALMCDLRVVEEDACLGFFNRKYGFALRDGGAGRLGRLIGASRALDLVLTGRPIGGKEALELGVANRLVATGTALGQAVTLAKSIAKHPQASLLFDRKACYEAINPDPSDIRSAAAKIPPIEDAIREEMRRGVEAFNTNRGNAGKTYNTKHHEMADWEIAEYNIEMKNRPQ